MRQTLMALNNYHFLRVEDLMNIQMINKEALLILNKNKFI